MAFVEVLNFKVRIKELRSKEFIHLLSHGVCRNAGSRLSNLRTSLLLPPSPSVTADLSV